jgi:putative sterol carrier protein
MKFLTQEMLDEVMKRAEADPQSASKFKKLNIRIVLLATDAPGNEDRQAAITLVSGKFTGAKVTIQPAPGEMRTAPFDAAAYDARVVSPYDTLVELLSGEINMMRMMKALGKMKIDGSKSKLMTQAGGFIALLESLGAVQVEY